MMPKGLIEKFNKIREIYRDGEVLVGPLERNLRKRIVASKLKDNDIVKVIIADTQKRLDVIDTVLSSDEALSETERVRYFQEKRTHQFWLGRLGYDIGPYIANLEKIADSYLSTEEPG